MTLTPTPPARFAAAVAALHGAYYLLTGVWPLIHLDSFLAVTGPKTDLWLVQTFGGLIAAVGVALLVAAWRGPVSAAVVTLAVGCAAALATADVVFVSRGVIPPIYLADAAAEAALVALWATAAMVRPAAPRR